METQKVSMKKVFIIAGALCAYWVGAGFATGQEILQFLSTSGVVKGIIGAVIYSSLLGFFVYTLCGLGQKMQFSNPYDFFVYYCGKHIGRVYIWFSVVLMYGIYVVMLAGAGAIIEQYYGIPASIGTYCAALLALGTALLGVEKLIDTIGVIGPANIVSVLAICIIALTAFVQQPDLLLMNGELIQTAGFPTASDSWFWSAILWAFLGLMFGSTFFVISGSSCKSLKEARISGLLAVGAIFIAIVLVIIAEIVYLDVIKGQQVPMLAIAKHVAPGLAMIFVPVLMVCIYCSMSSILLVVTRKFAVDKTKKFNFIAVTLTAIGMFAGTLLPFDQLVNLLYPVSGYSGIALVAFIIYKEFMNKNAFPFEKSGNGLEKQKIEV